VSDVTTLESVALTMTPQQARQLVGHLHTAIVQAGRDREFYPNPVVSLVVSEMGEEDATVTVCSTDDEHGVLAVDLLVIEVVEVDRLVLGEGER
jgi:hypothetical protein